MTPQEFADAVAAIESVQTVTLPPGAVLVVRVDRHLTAEQVHDIRSALREVFPGRSVLVLTPDVSLEVAES